MLGGPLYQLHLRGRLLSPPAALVERRIAVFFVLTWLLLLALTLASGTAVTGVRCRFCSTSTCTSVSCFACR